MFCSLQQTIKLFRKIPPRNGHLATITQARALSADPGPDTRSGRGVQRDMVTEAFEAFNGLARDPFVVALIEVLDAKVDIGLLPFEHVPKVHGFV